MNVMIDEVIEKIREYDIFTDRELEILFKVSGKSEDTLRKLFENCTDFYTVENFVNTCENWDTEDDITAMAE